MNLTEDSKLYTSNVFLIMGEWNTLTDLNTLIDVGSDMNIIEKLERMNTGLGKRKVDQVILTHTHSDHTAILPEIIRMYHPTVYSFNTHHKGVDKILKDEDIIKIGDQNFEVFHITTHSYDSICLYNEQTGILFAGDTYFPIEIENNPLKPENINVINRLKKKNIQSVYYGHGPVQHFTNYQFRILV